MPGFDGVLGHECVAKVVECPSHPDLVGEKLGSGVPAQAEVRVCIRA